MVNRKINSALTFTIILLVSTLITSCHNADPKVTTRIDSVMAVLDSTHAIAARIDFEKEEENAKKIKSDLEFIQNNFKDTLTKDMGFVLSDYRGIVAEEEEEQGGHENYEKMLKKELEYSRMQILNLKHDFEKTDIPAEDFKKYFESESTAVSKLHAFVLTKQAEFLKKEQQFNSLQPKVQAFIDSLKK